VQVLHAVAASKLLQPPWLPASCCSHLQQMLTSQEHSRLNASSSLFFLTQHSHDQAIMA
jgi:hypothetical protein